MDDSYNAVGRLLRQTAMRQELEQRPVERWPWFNLKGDLRHTRMPFGFHHRDGWFDIVWRLCEDLERLVAEAEKATGEPFEVIQAKEKFGGRCFYVNHKTHAITERIHDAGIESMRTCEVCGQPGTLREQQWMQTPCEEHLRARLAAASPQLPGRARRRLMSLRISSCSPLRILFCANSQCAHPSLMKHRLGP
jgi:hypothetical protein